MAQHPVGCGTPRSNDFFHFDDRIYHRNKKVAELKLRDLFYMRFTKIFFETHISIQTLWRNPLRSLLLHITLIRV
jgi:hypothetical protein